MSGLKEIIKSNKDNLNKIIKNKQNGRINLHPYSFVYLNYPKRCNKIDLKETVNYLLGNSISINKTIHIPLHNDPILQVIIDTDPRFKQKGLKIKRKDEILEISQNLNIALNFIKNTDEQSFNDIVDDLKMIVLFDANYVHNFTADKIYNIIFFSPPKDASIIFYVDSLIHESSHNKLNIALLNFEDFFEIDPYAKVFSSPFRDKDYKRGLFHVIHALYVITNLCAFYDAAFQKIDKDNPHYNETLGRLILNIKHLQISIEEIDYEPFYKNLGLLLLSHFKETRNTMSKKYKFYLEKFKIPENSNTHLFSLRKFKEINKL